MEIRKNTGSCSEQECSCMEVLREGHGILNSDSILIVDVHYHGIILLIAS